MKLGLIWGYWSAQPPTDWVPLTQEAEKLDVDTVWTSESWGSDAFSPLAHLAAVTEKIHLRKKGNPHERKLILGFQRTLEF